ncbi:signal transduction histidine kinase [Allocatelliglobosispora scoriae]|uniref:histidine kinase n=1 Tax=Allocatelliglobosispora scoriae TaxID=643052 RepID=A0A841C173_9ACTN|nr:nitrate- and nitrite sensing domain-containing protein [Allocatelliglobosispora scoriae]MBB5872893.1 signal transduction histidine kinase [Allocatelliglobosispora scoriae]
MLPVVVALIGVGALGLVQTAEALNSATDAQRSRQIAQALSATVKLGHQLEQEVAETADLLLRGGTAGQQLLIAQRIRTEEAMARFREATAAAALASPAVRELLDEAEEELDNLSTTRYRALHPDVPPGGVPVTSDRAGSPEDSSPEAAYDELTHTLVAVAEAYAVQPVDPRLAASARVVSVLTGAEHRAAEQRGLLREVFTRGRFEPGELAQLGMLRGAEQERLAELDRIATPVMRSRYAAVVSGVDVENARSMIEKALQADSRSDALKVDSDAWYIAQTNALRRLYLFELEAIGVLEEEATFQAAVAQTQAVVSGISTAAIMALTFYAALSLAVRTSRRLRNLRQAALAVANTELPGAIAAVTEAPSPDTVRAVIAASTERSAASLPVDADEIGEVSAAIGALHRQALRLASDQALQRLDIAGVFVALSRRGQTLVNRQLALIDEFELVETDPETLSRLFRLDHLAARMRRNEENLLVLAGGEPGRTFPYPELLSDVVLAAAAEIEDYARIDATAVPELWVSAHCVGDLVHLIAELVENATLFSPPTSRVQVSTHRAPEELTISVFDRGIGIPAGQLAQINERLAHPSRLTSELASRMGLLVVARLAERLQVGVELHSAPGQGTMALVRLPARLLATAEGVAARRNAEAAARAASAPVAASVAPKIVARGHARPVGNGNGNDLPVRDPGDALAPALIDDPAQTVVPATIDPELIRARLTSLATGMAAHRQAAPPTRP